MKRLLFILLLIAISTTAHAQSFQISGGQQLFNAPEGYSDVYNNGLAGKFAINGRVSPAVDIQLGVSYSKSELKDQYDNISVSGGELSLTAFNVGIRLHPEEKQIVDPFLVGGGTLTIISTTDLEVEQFTLEGGTDTDIGLNGGGGFQINITNQFGLVTSAMYTWIMRENDDMKYWSFTGGIILGL